METGRRLLSPNQSSGWFIRDTVRVPERHRRSSSGCRRSRDHLCSTQPRLPMPALRARDLMVEVWIAVRAEATMSGKRAGITSASGPVLIIDSSLFFDVHIPFTGHRAIRPVLGTSLLIRGESGKTEASVDPCRSSGGEVFPLGPPLALAPFAFMRCRYGLHLDWDFSLRCPVVSLILGFPSWRLIEEPIRRTRRLR